MKETSWYGRISAAVEEEGDNPLLFAADNLTSVLPAVLLKSMRHYYVHYPLASVQYAPPLHSGKAFCYTRCCNI
ncbi:MAG: hypothetical protein WAT12_15595 [Candidatus Nitrotoga sp.]